MNIFLRELRANLKSLLIWCVIVILFSAVGFSKFSAFFESPDLLAILEGMPPAVLSALNMNAFNLTTVTGFWGIMVMYFSLVLAIAAAMWGSDIITKEERDRTVEFALTLPVTRARLVTAKIAAVVFNCVVLVLVTWVFSLVNAQNYKPDDQFYRFVSVSMLSFFVIQMVFMALGILLGCALKKYKRASAAVVGILLGTYAASFISGLGKDMEFLKYISPFEYFDAVVLMRDGSLDTGFVLLSLAIIAACLAAAYAAYQRRDLYI